MNSMEQKSVNSHEYSLHLEGLELTDTVIDAFYDSGGSDAVLGKFAGKVIATYTREAESQAKAVLSSITEVEAIGFKVTKIVT